MNPRVSLKVRRVILLLAFSLLPLDTLAHIGSPTIFFDGRAGPYPLHVIIQPAEVIPGLAEISIRTGVEGVERVTALPMMWNTGRKGAPPPDIARPVPGETNLFRAQLWFMEEGAQSVELALTGSSGPGRVTIPVDAVATRVLKMPRGLGTILALLGLLLLALFLSIVGAAVRESVVEPGHVPTSQRRSAALVAMLGGLLLMGLLLRGGEKWWNAEASDYTNDRLYRPLKATVSVEVENAQRVLRLSLPTASIGAPLVPDHGKLVHLFLMREPGLDAFAHLHPHKRDPSTYESPLPDLPAGLYRVYGDVTHETGFSETIAVTVRVPDKPAGVANASTAITPDSDDSWIQTTSLSTNSSGLKSQLSPKYSMTWIAPRRIVANQPLTLRFTVNDSQEKPAVLETYLGMRGHLVLARDDGSVFTHLHPGGMASMAAMQLSTLRAEGKLPLRAAFGEAEPICRLPDNPPGEQPWLSGNSEGDGVSFPYAFPKPGRYRLWVQVKIDGEIFTGVFDPEVIATGDAIYSMNR